MSAMNKLSRYLCETCGEFFNSAILHEECDLFKCKLCSKMFKKERYLKLHMHKHRGLSYECYICMRKGKEFDNWFMIIDIITKIRYFSI